MATNFWEKDAVAKSEDQWWSKDPEAGAIKKDEGFLSNIGSLLVEGGKRAIGAAQVAPSVISGDVGSDKAKLLSQQLSMPEGVRPKELVEAQSAFKDEAEAFEKAKGFTESIIPVGQFMLEFGKQVLTNPKGAVYLSAQSAANMAPQIAGMIAGGKGGAALGSLGGPAGALIGAGVGSVGGGFAASAPLEVGSEFIGRIGDALRDKGLEPTEENIAALLRDKKLVEQAVSDARTKGATTAAVDSLMTVGAGRFATAPRRAAIEAAKKELGVAADAAKIAARADDILKTRTLGQKVGRGAGAVGIDVAGDAASEIAGQSAAYGKVNLEDVGQEMLGGIGASMVEVPAAAYSLGREKLQAAPATETPTPTTATPAAPATPAPSEIEQRVADIEDQQQRQRAAMDRAAENMIGGSGEVNQELLTQARIRKEQQERAAAAEEKAAEDERKKELRAERVRIANTQYSGDPMMNEVLRSRAVAEFDAANAPKPVEVAPIEYTPTKTIEQTTPVEQPEGINVLRGLESRNQDLMSAMAERRAAQEATAESLKQQETKKTEAARSDVDQRVGQVENFLMTTAKKTQQETSDYIAGVIPEMEKDIRALFDEDMNQPLTKEQTEALKSEIRQRLQPEVAKEAEVKRTPFKSFLASKGMNTKDVQDIFGENAFRANQQLPGAIKASGPRLDMLAEAAVQEGFMQEEDVDQLVQMIKDEFGGDQQVAANMADEQAASEYEAQRENEVMSRAGAIGLDTKGMTVDEVANRLDRIERQREAKRKQYSKDVDGFADLPTAEQDRIIDVMTDRFGEPQVFDVGRAEIEGLVREDEELLKTRTEKQDRIDNRQEAKPDSESDLKKSADTSKGYNISAEDQRIEKELSGKSMIQAADWTVANAPNAFAKVIAEKVRSRLREFQRKGMTLDFVIEGGSTRTNKLRSARGVTQFEWGKDDKGTKITVTLNGAAVMNNQGGYPPGVQYNTILHELLHVATRSQFAFMPNTDPLRKQMTELFNTVVGRFNADAKAGNLPPVMEKYYKRMNNVLEDPDELLTWGLTDKEVQAYLDDIKVGEKSVFTQLVELIRKALGLGKPYESALERLVRTSESLLDVDVDTIDSMLGSKDKQIGVKKKPSGPMAQESLFQKEGPPKTGPGTAAFNRWFGDSKVVDENGEPMVVYHGTFVRPMGDGTDMGDIKAFDRMFTTKFRRPSIDTVGSWFSTNPGQGGAEMYSGSDPGSVVYPVYLSIKNPQVTTFQLMTSRARKLHNGKDDGRPIGTEEVEAYRTWLKSMGKDGIKIEASGNEGSTEFDNQVAWIALEPTQIKSATGNAGTYDPENADIRYQREAKSNPNQAAQANLDILDATGMQLQPPEPGRIQKIKDILRAAGENPELTKASAKTAVTKFLDKMEVAAFSGDAAFNNDIRRNLEKDFAEHPEILGMLLEASQSQAVHSDALATRFIVDGGIFYDTETKKWVSIKKEDNFIKLAQQIEKSAEKYGLTKEQMEQISHTYFVAKRFKDLLKKQNARDAEIERLEGELADENANIKQYKKDGDFEKLRTSERAKNDIRNDIEKLKKASVLISEDQRAMIEPGLSLLKNMPELEDISDTWQGIRANAVKAMVDGGLWSLKQSISMLDEAAYVPFYRDEQLEEGGGPQEFVKGLQVKGKEYRLKGSNAAVNDIFDNMVRWTQYAINRSVRNHKALQMVDIGTKLQVGDGKMAEKVGKMDSKLNTIRVFRNGKQEIYKMADPLYIDAFSSISNVTIPSLKFFTWFANTLRQSVVLYPLFSLAQIPQDSFSAMFSSGLKTRFALRIPVLAVKEFVKTIAKTSATHNLLQSYGATGVRDFNATVARNDIQIAAGLKGQKALVGKTKEFLSHFAMAADNSVRQAVYEASTQQGLSKSEAIEKAFDIINFRRRGTSKMVNLLGQVVPFFYAYMSVQRTAYKTLTGVGISPQKRSEALSTLATTTGAVMALSLLYTMLNGGDDEYEKTPTAVRDRTLNIPGTGGARIPLRPDLFLLPKVVTEHVYHLITDNGFSDGEKFRKSVRDLMANALLSPQPIPQAVKPALEVAINYDFFQGRPLIGQFEKQKDAERQFNDNTSEFSKMLGSLGMSPIAADHLIRGMFGSAGGLFMYMTNFMINSDPDVPRPELSFREAMAALPGTSGFVTKPNENALKNDFYALRDEVEKVKSTYNDIKMRSPQELEQFLSDEKNIARLGLAKGTEKIGAQLSKIRRAITQITNAPEDLYSASAKREAIKELRDAEREMLKSIDIGGMRKAAQM